MSVINQNEILKFAKLVVDAGWEWCGVQESIPPEIPKMVVRKGKITKYVPAEPETFDPGKLAKAYLTPQENKMTLKEKLHAIYEALTVIEKRGENTMQHYDYVKAADVTHAIRKQLVTQKVYAEINFDFVGGPFNIARAKDKDAPFSAVLVKCSIVFHDLESNEILTGSGLGTGADTGDKAAYKAQTGALKYALKNSFLVADDADPEADTSVDEGGYSDRPAPEEIPDFQDVKRGPNLPAQPVRQDRPTQAASKAAEENPFESPAPKAAAIDPEIQQYTDIKGLTESLQDGTIAPENVPGKGDAFEGPDDDGAMPSEVELADFTKKYHALGTALADKGKLKASKGIPAPIKLKTFLLSVTGAPTPKKMTKAQWLNFYARVDKALANSEVGYVGLVKIINKANGVDDKK